MSSELTLAFLLEYSKEFDVIKEGDFICCYNEESTELCGAMEEWVMVLKISKLCCMLSDIIDYSLSKCWNSSNLKATIKFKDEGNLAKIKRLII